jgi:hypothetical protein
MYLGGPTGVVQHQHRMAGTYVTAGGRNNQRPPNVSIGPDGINIGGRGSAEWRHLLLSQQQSAVFGTQMRPAFTQGGHQGKLPSDCLNCSHSVALLRDVVVVVYMKTVLWVLLCVWWMVAVCTGHTVCAWWMVTVPATQCVCVVADNGLYRPHSVCVVDGNGLYWPHSVCVVDGNCLYRPHSVCVVDGNGLYWPHSVCVVDGNCLYRPIGRAHV